MIIKGMNIEKYVGYELEGFNCEFEEKKCIKERYFIYAVQDDKNIVIELYETETECCSGWTTAYYGNMYVKIVKNFGSIGYIPKNGTIEVPDIDMKLIDKETGEYTEEEFVNDVFVYKEDGGDEYYPVGSAYVKTDLFKKTARAKEKRPVWIFKGESCSGKSYLSHLIDNKSVYETDSNESLPETIYDDIIVLGNKYKFTIDEIKSKVFEKDDTEFIVVDFSICNN